MLPQQSLLPLLVSLVNKQPEIKSALVTLMPRPSLESALQLLNQAAARLREAHPFSAAPTRPSSRGQIARTSHLQYEFSQIPNRDTSRDAYTQSWITPHLTEFVTTVVSSLPFFSLRPTALSLSTHLSRQVKIHPSETFSYLAAVTRILLSFPQSTQMSLGSMLTARLIDEWNAWLQ